MLHLFVIIATSEACDNIFMTFQNMVIIMSWQLYKFYDSVLGWYLNYRHNLSGLVPYKQFGKAHSHWTFKFSIKFGQMFGWQQIKI